MSPLAAEATPKGWSRALQACRAHQLRPRLIHREPDLLVAMFLLAEQGAAALDGAGVISQREREEAAALRAGDDAALHRLSRAALRVMVAAEEGLPAASLDLVRPPDAGPRVPTSSLRLGLAHTQGAALIGVSRHASVGVDVERADRQLRLSSLIRRSCTTAEAAWVESPADDESRRQRFLQLWTRKEAWLKARGMGVSSGMAAAPGIPAGELGAAEAAAQVSDALVGGYRVAWGLAE